MEQLIIIAKETKGKKLILFLDDKEEGVFTDRIQIKLSNISHTIQIGYDDKKSNILKIDKKNKNYLFEVNKALSANQLPRFALRTLIPLLMMSFCFHMAFGVGPYVLAIVIVLLVFIAFSKRDKLVVRPLQK